MRTNLVKRVERIEQRTMSGDGITAIFRRIVEPGFIDSSANGWSFGDDGDRVKIFRVDGETDDKLRERAATLAREKIGGGIPRLISL
jgi:hypothetical protein